MYNEKILVTRLKDSSTREAAFRTLVHEFQEQLYWQIRRMVTNHQDADDVLQNVFMKAWMGLDNFRGESQLSTWLYRIASNETLNFLQRNNRTTLSLDNTVDEGEGNDSQLSALSSQLVSDPYFDGDETQRQLQKAVESLPPKQRQVFTMKYFREMKYEEMSDVLGTSIGALKASYHHAVKKVVDFFEVNG